MENSIKYILTHNFWFPIFNKTDILFIKHRVEETRFPIKNIHGDSLGTDSLLNAWDRHLWEILPDGGWHLKYVWLIKKCLR